MVRKTVAWALSIILPVAFLAGCGGPAAPQGTAAEIANKVFVQAGIKPFGAPTALSGDAEKEALLGSRDYPQFADSAVSLPMISIDTRVLYIIKAAKKGDVETIKTKLRANINPNRLVCVKFSLEDVVIDSRGEVIFMTINTKAEQRTALAESFKTIE